MDFLIFVLCIGLVGFFAGRIKIKKLKTSGRQGKRFFLTPFLVFALGLSLFNASGCGSGLSGTQTSVSEISQKEETQDENSDEEDLSISEEEIAEEPRTDLSVDAESETEVVAPSEDATGADGTIQITMLDVHQGLSILVDVDGQYMLYDGGGRSRSSYVVAYLKSHNVTELEYMFASHYDEDHIAGLVGVLNTTTVDTVVCPEYTTDTKIYQSFVNGIAQNGAATVYPAPGDVYHLNGCTITILSPQSYGDSDNDNSVAVRLVYGDFSCIITGDAEEASEQEMVRSGLTLDSDIYVAGHHGSSSSSSTAFLNAVTPMYTFISCGADNSYGHPTEAALERIKAVGSQIFRTDKQGEVTATYDGNQLTFSTNPCEDWTPGNSGESETDSMQTSDSESGSETAVSNGTSSDGTSAERTYVLNTNTKKFHYPDCSSVKQMKDKNKKEVTATRDEIIAEGYDPCQNCNP